MATFYYILLLSATVYGIAAQNGGGATTEGTQRMGKYFFGAAFPDIATKLVVDDLIVTTIVPSSCVAFEPTLRPCRRFRFLNYGPLYGPATVQNNQSQSLPNTTVNSNRQQSTIGSTPPLTAVPILRTRSKNGAINSKPSAAASSITWGDFMNYVRGIVPTTTKTATRITTETYYDPARVITFSIKHCLPSQMPFNLPKCPQYNEVGDIKKESSPPAERPVGEHEINGNVLEPTLTWSLPKIVTTSVVPSQLTVTTSSTEAIPPLGGEQEPQQIDNNAGTFIKPSEIIY